MVFQLKLIYPVKSLFMIHKYHIQVFGMCNSCLIQLSQCKDSPSATPVYPKTKLDVTKLVVNSGFVLVFWHTCAFSLKDWGEIFLYLFHNLFCFPSFFILAQWCLIASHWVLSSAAMPCWSSCIARLHSCRHIFDLFCHNAFNARWCVSRAFLDCVLDFFQNIDGSLGVSFGIIFLSGH